MATDPVATRLFEHGTRISGEVTIQKRAIDLYNVWSRFEQLPRFLDEVESVTREGDVTHWAVRGPAGRTYTWDAAIINEEPARIIAWRADVGASVQHAGAIRFVELPFSRGTEVRAVIEYLPPGGAAGVTAAKLLGKDPEEQLQKSLHQFRQLMETGEVAISEGQPVGKNRRRSDRPGESERSTDPQLQDLAPRETQP